MTSQRPSARTRRPRSPAVGVVTAVLVVQLLAIFCFAYVRTGAAPTDLPVGLVGPAPLTEELRHGMAEAAPGAFDLTAYDSAADARAGIRDRDVYGALVLEAPAGAPGAQPDGATAGAQPAQPGEEPPAGPDAGSTAGPRPTATLLVSTAASAQVAGQLGDALTPALAARGVTVEVADVVPTDPDDPTGGAITSMALPLVLTTLAAALVVFLLAPGRRGLHAVLLPVFAVAAGLGAAFLLVDGLGVLPGSTWELAGVVSLGVLAVALTAYAGGRLLGRAGLGLVVLTMLLVGVQAAAIPAPELLPGFWRQVGPWLPPSALVEAARNTVYFDGAALATPLTVLAAYAGLGALTLLPLGRGRRAAGRPPAAPANGHRHNGEEPPVVSAHSDTAHPDTTHPDTTHAR